MEQFIWKMIPGAAGRDMMKWDRERKVARKACSIKPATSGGDWSFNLLRKLWKPMKNIHVRVILPEEQGSSGIYTPTPVHHCWEAAPQGFHSQHSGLLHRWQRGAPGQEKVLRTQNEGVSSWNLRLSALNRERWVCEWGSGCSCCSPLVNTFRRMYFFFFFNRHK